MTNVLREFGVIGLGRMGGGLALQARDKGMKVAGLDVGGLKKEMASAGVLDAKTLSGFRELLKAPRAVFLYIPSGPPVDEMLDQLADVLEAGDVMIDGGNSYWGDSIRRHHKYKQKGVQLVDLGTSGGVGGAREGACFMAGGEDQAIARIEPILKELAVPGGYVHAGPPGAGHFVKLVHNGIEFGMLQAIGEGVDVMEHYHDKLSIADVLSCWRNGSVIRSWLIDLMEGEYRDKGGLKEIPAYIEDTGEVNWLVSDAIQMERPIPVISQAVMQLFASRDDNKDWARAIAMMRNGFGGHPFGSDEPIQRERKTGRVGEIWRAPYDPKKDKPTKLI